MHAKKIHTCMTRVLILYSNGLLAINCVNNQLLNMYLPNKIHTVFFIYWYKKYVYLRSFYFSFFLKFKMKIHKQNHEVENCYRSKPISFHSLKLYLNWNTLIYSHTEKGLKHTKRQANRIFSKIFTQIQVINN